MNLPFYFVLFAAGLLIGLPLVLELGRRLGARRAAVNNEASRAGLNTVESAVFGLLGLLIAFTFSSAMSRFDARRQLIVEEANSIGTAYLRLDLLLPDDQPRLRQLFRQYLDSRLGVYRKLPDISAAKKELAESGRLQNEIWITSVAACRQSGSPSTQTLLITALNQMIDLTTTRTMATRTHPPIVIFCMLALLALAAALLSGFAMAGTSRRSWLHYLVFSFTVAVTVYVTLDLEFPRLGFIRVNSFDQVLQELRQGMNEKNIAL